jgi:CyaY protein
MERSEFLRRAGDALAQIDQALEVFDDPRLDVELAGDVMTVRFDDGTRYIINAHSAAGQIWMAAETNAWHFDFQADTGKWLATRQGDELHATVQRVVRDKLTK